MKACFFWNRRQGHPRVSDNGEQLEENKDEKEVGAEPPRATGCPAPPEALLEELRAARDLQLLHAGERQKDARSFQRCLRSARAMERHVQELRGRLAGAEARLGLPAADAAE